jgi:hypothetical protein
MQEIAYTVTATLPDAKLAKEWLDWLRSGHIADVLAGGATSAEIIAVDQPSLTFEVRYRFPNRRAFDRYEQEISPRLRAEGLKRFPPEKGISYRRSVGGVISGFP